MEPRGQLWFELQRVCSDFREFSGLSAEEAVRILVAVLRNLLVDQEEELERLASGTLAPPEAAGPH